MTLFFDTKAQFLDGDAISTVCAWHSNQPLFAVASYNQDRGASITLFDDTVRITNFSLDTLIWPLLNLLCFCFLFRANHYEMSPIRFIQLLKRQQCVGIRRSVFW